MALPHTFFTIAAPGAPASYLDDNFNAVGALTVIPCTVSGTNALTLTPAANSPVPAYANIAAFSGIAANTNSGAVTANVAGLGVRNVYKDTSSGPAALTGNEIIAGNVFVLFFNLALNSGAGGFHLQTSTTVSLPSIADQRLLANISGGAAAAAPQSISDVFDNILSNVQGAVLARSASNWAANLETAWTPAIAFGGASVGVTYGTQIGRYLSIGYLTIGSFTIVLTSKGSSTGAATLSLPASAGGSGRKGSLVLSDYTALDAAVTTMPFGSIAASAAVATLRKAGAGTITALADTDFTNTSALSGFVYLFTG